MSDLLQLLIKDFLDKEIIENLIWLFPISLSFLFQYLSETGEVRPEIQFGELFKAVQLKAIFADSKTFPDCIPVLEPEIIMEAYEAEKDHPDFDLKEFVLRNFKLPAEPGTNFTSDSNLSVTEHIKKLWPILTRPVVNDFSSRIHLPYPYVVPGGRFREIYYWDSYFTMLGLQEDGEIELIEQMVDNFTYLIYTVGHIPNGNRSYYKSRSQPPFYALMLKLLCEIKGEGVYKTYGPALRKEYEFWMDGADSLNEKNICYRRVVRLPDGSILNRFYDDCAEPRPESYIEDIATSRFSPQNPEDLYRNIRAGAESGWDFTSRWFADGKTMETIHTCDLIPVDLNCLVYYMECTLSHVATLNGDDEEAEFFKEKATKRKRAILKYCWSPKLRFFMDYNFKTHHHTSALTLAAVYPLYFNIALPKQAECVAERLNNDFLKPGGLVITLNHTHEQWDAPNGWAALQWMAIQGLRHYGFIGLANRIKERWIHLNIEIYKATGKLVEKYNVEDPHAPAGGGEYALQDGFGWTNGVLLKLLSEASVDGTEHHGHI
ncbi:alpha,alpha-trehalase TreF [Adhaeribacter aquaticus]|uniref:alpha,alpha-trehalase TreF n=1 Tax=Adhaeribacter aquaticus TaxID=299567 RepID=UPI0003FC5A84|nr:alpha,alpha-trehalase TreF [Adhaeribacter aquaticus]